MLTAENQENHYILVNRDVYTIVFAGFFFGNCGNLQSVLKLAIEGFYSNH